MGNGPSTLKIFTYVKGKQEKQERNDRKQTFCLLFSKQAGKTFLLFCPCLNSDKQTMGKGILVTDEQKKIKQLFLNAQAIEKRLLYLL